MSVLIRTGEVAELAALRAVFRRAALSNAGDREQLLANPDTLLWPADALVAGRTRVAVEDGRIVGFASTLPLDGALELEDLFVEPDHRRRGVARRLVEDVLDRAREQGVGLIRVSANEHAMPFYTAVGFRPDGVEQTRFGPTPRLRLDF